MELVNGYMIEIYIINLQKSNKYDIIQMYSKEGAS